MTERAVQVRVVIDEKGFKHPSSTGQIRQLQELARGSSGNLELRTLKPEHNGEGMYNSQHMKQVICDDEVVVIGSANLTHQSDRNYEGVVVIREVKTVDDARVHFDTAWVRGTRVLFDELYNWVQIF